MSGCKCNISLIIVLVSLVSVQAFSQEVNYRDSLAIDNSQKVILKPQMHYSLGTSFMVVPHLGSVTGLTITPSLSLPISARLSVDGGIIAGHYLGLWNPNHEAAIREEFNELSLFGSATYHINSQLTLYGAGIKQITSSSPFLLPKSSYVIGSSYNFGNFSIGVSMQMSKWNDNLNPMPFNGSQGFYSPFEQRTAH
jgi:hypothetical protein